MAKVTLILEDIEMNGQPGVRMSTTNDSPEGSDPTAAETLISDFVQQVIEASGGGITEVNEASELN